MLFWGNVYGVGNAKSSPVSAVMTDIFMTTVDCVVGLVAGDLRVDMGSDEKLQALLGWSSLSNIQHKASSNIQSNVFGDIR